MGYIESKEAKKLNGNCQLNITSSLYDKKKYLAFKECPPKLSHETTEKKQQKDSPSAYEIIKIARHKNRPTSREYVELMCSSFIELHGDRCYGDDPALIGGLAKIENTSVMILGTQKGKNTKENIKHNFGMVKPEGYRKSLRLMKMAESYNLPIIALIDTPGAYPGVEAEKRGQSQTIANNIISMCQLRCPTISIITGEGGSGGALALATASTVHMFEFSVYSVISPEGCSAILLKDAKKANLMAQALKLTAEDALNLGIIDSIINEPKGGSHNSKQQAASSLKKTILDDLKRQKTLSTEALIEKRLSKFLSLGHYLQ